MHREHQDGQHDTQKYLCKTCLNEYNKIFEELFMIYDQSSRVNGKFTRLFCVGNYPDVLVIDPMSLDVLYTLVSREQPQWIKALCINTLANKQDDVIVGVSIVGTIKLWTVNANETKVLITNFSGFKSFSLYHIQI